MCHCNIKGSLSHIYFRGSLCHCNVKGSLCHSNFRGSLCHCNVEGSLYHSNVKGSLCHSNVLIVRHTRTSVTRPDRPQGPLRHVCHTIGG